MGTDRNAPRSRSIPRGIYVAVGVTLLVVIAGFAVRSSPTGSSDRVPTDARLFGPSVTAASADCAVINSNASLDSTYVGIYDGVAHGFDNWTPAPNWTRPVNQSGYPNVTDGEQQLIAAWTSICESSVYQGLYLEWGPDSVSSGYELNGTTGHYQSNYGFAYHASCSDPEDSSNADCGYFTTWYVDLATGEVEGPWTTPMGTPFGSGPPPCDFCGGAPSPATVLGLPAIQGYAVLAGVIAAVGLGTLAAVLLHRRGRTPPSSTSTPAPP